MPILPVCPANPFDLSQTAFFPLTANPVGFHHLLLAECVLLQCPEVRQIVFILSNGQHPDPTKASATAPKQERLQAFEEALEEWSDPHASLIARLAPGHLWRLTPERGFLWTLEFEHPKPFRLAEHFQAILAQSIPNSGKVRLILGHDLIERMKNPAIFNQADLEYLAQHGLWLSAPREKGVVEPALQALREQRGLELCYQTLDLGALPEAVWPWLQLSSTQIRRLAASPHGLLGCLPQKAAERVKFFPGYQANAIGGNEWQKACWEAEQSAIQAARELKAFWDMQASQRLPCHLVVIESGTGGALSAALTSLPGASRYFQEGAIVYDQASKQRWTGKLEETQGAVSLEMARALAVGALRLTGADWALSETSMAGPPEGQRQSLKQGTLCLGLAGPQGFLAAHTESLSPFMSKREHQWKFAQIALQWYLHHLKALGGLQMHSKPF